MARLDDVKRFYDLMDQLRHQLGGYRYLGECHGRMDWPSRGVYFFFENGETRSDSGSGPRIVRVGTHAVSAHSRRTLWQRLSDHRGSVTGDGNHRGSVFRLLVGSALATRDRLVCNSWGIDIPRDQRNHEAEWQIEQQVTAYIGAMPFLWVEADDEPGAASIRKYIERNSIALLSNYHRQTIDAHSDTWLGQHCPKERIRLSGLWNSDHVDEESDCSFLPVLGDLIRAMSTKGR